MLHSDQLLRTQLPRQLDDIPCQFVICRVDELRPHPSYARNHLTVSALQLSALIEQGDLAFQEPIVITPDRTILDGYGRVKLARSTGRATLLCVIYDLNETEALQYLLQSHRRSNGWNAFTRILLALDLVPGLEAMARSNQRAGGQNKGLSKLTEAKRLSVRSEVAAVAGARSTNVGKVTKLIMTAPPEILKALLNEEISIHRAWLWSKLSPEEQRENLRQNQSKRGIGKTIRRLLAPHLPKNSHAALNIGHLISLVSALQSAKPDSVRVVSVDVPGKAVFVTKELLRTLDRQENLELT
jgi:hypothetical protein